MITKEYTITAPGSVNGGGHAVTVKTVNGNVTVVEGP